MNALTALTWGMAAIIALLCIANAVDHNKCEVLLYTLICGLCVFSALWGK